MWMSDISEPNWVIWVVLDIVLVLPETVMVVVVLNPRSTIVVIIPAVTADKNATMWNQL